MNMSETNSKNPLMATPKEKTPLGSLDSINCYLFYCHSSSRSRGNTIL